jgi:hypothetical protein
VPSTPTGGNCQSCVWNGNNRSPGGDGGNDSVLLAEVLATAHSKGEVTFVEI